MVYSIRCGESAVEKSLKRDLVVGARLDLLDRRSSRQRDSPKLMQQGLVSLQDRHPAV